MAFNDKRETDDGGVGGVGVGVGFGPCGMPPFARFKKRSGNKQASVHDYPDNRLSPLESKNAVRRVKEVGNFRIFEAAVTPDAAQRRLIDDLVALFGGRAQPVMSRLIESGNLTLQDVKEAPEDSRKLNGRH